MPVTINTNTSATYAANNLNKSNAMLQKSLNRLSSGTRIVNPADDAGGLAVSMRMSATIARTDAVLSNITNGTSFLQTQDGALKTVGSILNRVSELKTLYNDGTKSTADKGLYDKEFVALRNQLRNIMGAPTSVADVAGTLDIDETAVSSAEGSTFNGVPLFTEDSSVAESLSVNISEDGSQSVSITVHALASDTNMAAVMNGTTLADSGVTLDNIIQSIDKVANARAQNGAEQSRLQFAGELLTVNRANLESANSRIIDVDVAQESTALARYNILTQAGTAMLAQANSSAQNALRLLQG